VKPFQSVDNPHDIVTDRNTWVRFEFERQRGSLQGLTDYAKRYVLMNMVEEENPTPAIKAALAYLLEMGLEVGQ